MVSLSISLEAAALIDATSRIGYASPMDAQDHVRIEIATDRHRDLLTTLIADIEAEDHPENPRARAEAPDGMRRSLLHYDALGSDSVWFLLAHAGETPVGLAILIRIPKLDHRRGFLYLDELSVLEPWRRQGIGRRLMERSIELSREVGLAGLRLLTQEDNAPARALYESVGMTGGKTLLYQLRFDS